MAFEIDRSKGALCNVLSASLLIGVDNDRPSAKWKLDFCSFDKSRSTSEKSSSNLSSSSVGCPSWLSSAPFDKSEVDNDEETTVPAA
jgi:hypothetical protein